MPNRKPQTRVVLGITLTQTERNGYEFELPDQQRDFHVRLEGNRWILDVFDSSIQDANTAHRTSEEFETLEKAVEAATRGDYRGPPRA